MVWFTVIPSRELHANEAAGRRLLAESYYSKRRIAVSGTGSPRCSNAALLQALVVKFRGGPVGLSTLAVAVSEEPDTIEDVYEPYLMRLGFLQRTPRGRIATRAAFEHLGEAVPEAAIRLFE